MFEEWCTNRRPALKKEWDVDIGEIEKGLWISALKAVEKVLDRDFTRFEYITRKAPRLLLDQLRFLFDIRFNGY